MMNEFHILSFLITFFGKYAATVNQMTTAMLYVNKYIHDEQINKSNSISTYRAILKICELSGITISWPVINEAMAILDKVKLFNVWIYRRPQRKVQISAFMIKNDTRYWTRKSSIAFLNKFSKTHLMDIHMLLEKITGDKLNILLSEFRKESFYSYRVEEVK